MRLTMRLLLLQVQGQYELQLCMNDFRLFTFAHHHRYLSSSSSPSTTSNHLSFVFSFRSEIKSDEWITIQLNQLVAMSLCCTSWCTSEIIELAVQDRSLGVASYFSCCCCVGVVQLWKRSLTSLQKWFTPDALPASQIATEPSSDSLSQVGAWAVRSPMLILLLSRVESESRLRLELLLLFQS